MEGKIKYVFSGQSWQYGAPGGWYFVSLPHEMSQEIRTMLKSQEEGWGRLKAFAGIGSTLWETAIWYDRKQNTYILPLKNEIRKKENLSSGQTLVVNIWV